MEAALAAPSHPLAEPPAPPSANDPASPDLPPPLPALAEVVRGLGGWLALGTAGAVGAHGVAVSAFPGPLWTSAGAVVLTGPALLVVHQFLGLRAAPDRVIGSLAHALARSGHLALGLVPFQLFFSVTTQRGPAFLALLLGGIAGTGLLAAGRGLIDAEVATGTTGAQALHARALAVGWSVLTLLVGLRLGWEVMA